ncbi:cell division protein FtsL [Endozoicomonas sp. SCSIO W0465]|uniref:cell division protein FtsL n=1 Tax=Endozoicomonas sp. SCSIO W0465 TaxID=2918516 RepID=UPI00207570FF|nr:cell division protein FtsL [Endozoicomonas sp. SCSIO W0465]USE34883.1 cell division protein FtsL [Endozoicomonas sp. SCSIO W0465]
MMVNRLLVRMHLIRSHGAALLLLILVVLSGLSVGYVSYENRLLHNQIQQELENRNSAQVEWGKLLLEHSTLTSPGKIEKVAREKLGMDVPKTSQIEMVLP